MKDVFQAANSALKQAVHNSNSSGGPVTTTTISNASAGTVPKVWWGHQHHPNATVSPAMQDLYKQIRKLAQSAYKISGSIRSAHRGERVAYAIRSNRNALRSIGKKFEKATPKDCRAHLVHLQGALNALDHRARPGSMFKRFMVEHAEDITAIEVALRLIENSENKLEGSWTAVSPFSNMANPHYYKHLIKPYSFGHIHRLPHHNCPICKLTKSSTPTK